MDIESNCKLFADYITTKIDYNKISQALTHYVSRGYNYTEVPWIVQPETNKITAPKNAKRYITLTGDLVASGEQSFLQMYNKLKSVYYVCCTPCFRNEIELTDRTREYFIKVELIRFLDKNDRISDVLWTILQSAYIFFRIYHVKPSIIQIDKNSWDIEINNIEVGSYGFRNDEKTGISWVYGTGCAEPRLSYALCH